MWPPEAASPPGENRLAATRAFPHVTGVFLIVVVPPTVPAQLSAAAACYYGKIIRSAVSQAKK